MRGIALLCWPEDFERFVGLLWSGHPDLFQAATTKPN
jgi:hypothetical protein